MYWSNMIGIIDCGSFWTEDIERSIRQLNYDSVVIKMDVLTEADTERFSHIIISGRPTLLTQENIRELTELFDIIRTSIVPILGICFGHQIIGLLYGSQIAVGTSIEKMESIEILKEDKLFTFIKNQSLFQESHTEFISVPEDFILLAKSDSCQNEAMKHKKKLIYGTQFHPEASGKNGQKLIQNFLEMQ